MPHWSKHYTANQSDSSDPQEQVTTEDLAAAVDQRQVRATLVDAWLKALQAAEALQLRLHPSYLRHSERELVAFVDAALRNHRDPSQLVNELLAHGARSPARPRIA